MSLKPDLIVGLGATGLSVAEHFRSQNRPFYVWDTRKNPGPLGSFQTQFPEIRVHCGPDLPWADHEFDRVILSPGLSPAESPFDRWRLAGRLFSDIDLFVAEAKAPIWGVTGSNGKSTVTTLLGVMAQEAGWQVGIGGNLGPPALSLLSETTELYILELSSFQLELSQPITLEAAVFLNFSADHLDRHGSERAYWEAKQKIFEKARIQIFNADDPKTKPAHEGEQMGCFTLASPQSDRAVGLFSDPAGIRQLGFAHRALFPVEQARLKGRHQWANMAAALALVQATGRIPLAIQQRVLTDFSGLPHRCQWVRKMGGVDWFNDSKGTNVGATQAAIAGLGATVSGARIVWLAGGDGKGADFTALQKTVADHVCHAILFGQDAGKIALALGQRVPITQVPVLHEAVAWAHQVAQSGDLVLLSPACASWDQFQDYAHRGEVFAQLVSELTV